MNVIAMRDHRDLNTLSTDKLFSDLKAYKFEMLRQREDGDKEKRLNFSSGATIPITQVRRKIKYLII